MSDCDYKSVSVCERVCERWTGGGAGKGNENATARNRDADGAGKGGEGRMDSEDVGVR